MEKLRDFSASMQAKGGLNRMINLKECGKFLGDAFGFGASSSFVSIHLIKGLSSCRIDLIRVDYGKSVNRT